MITFKTHKQWASTKSLTFFFFFLVSVIYVSKFKGAGILKEFEIHLGKKNTN